MREQRAKLSRGNDVAEAMDYMLKRWTVFTRFLDDGRICVSNNAAERGRKSWLFCSSHRGGERAAVIYSLIVAAKMNNIDPQAWLVLARIVEHPNPPRSPPDAYAVLWSTELLSARLPPHQCLTTTRCKAITEFAV
jgi:hypothetical protein